MRSARRYPSIAAKSVVILKRAARGASIELLEKRQLLSSVLVNTAIDEIDAPGSPTVSLRDALAIASSANTPTTINFSPTVFATAQTITLLSSNGYLKLTSSQDVTITGPSAGVIVNGGGNSNVLVDQATGGNVNISNMTLTNGTANYGGGILHTGTDTLTLTNVTVSNSYAYYYGGGIYNSGTLIIDGSSITGNAISNPTASNGSGGGIDNDGGTLTVFDSTVSGNSVLSPTAAGGGGIANVNGGSANILSSTISGNTNYASNPSGGTLYNAPGGGVLSNATLTVTNSTISGNEGSLGGGMDITGGVTISDSTISGNIGKVGGGLYLTTADVIQNSVVAGNYYLSGGSSPDVANATSDSVASNGHNLIGESDGSTGWIASDIIGSIASPVSANLGALTNNGGPTQTMLPRSNSVLIDNGSNSLIPGGISTDQRGFARIYNNSVDIGAVEVQPFIAVTAPANQSAVIGQSQLFNLGSFTQSGTTGPYSVSVNWGDGSPATTFTANNSGTLAQQTHTFATAGVDTVTVTVTDSTGNISGNSTFTVRPASGSVTVIAPATQTAFVGVSQTITLGSFTENNAVAPYTVSVSWGDGSTNTTFTANAAGTITSQSHAFQQIGTKTVTVTVTDSSGVISGSATFTVTVAAGTITVIPPATQSVATGQSRTFSLGSFTATNAAGPFSVDVSWGDGTADTVFTANTAGTIASQTHSFNSTSTDTVTVTVTDASGLVTGNATFIVNVIGALIAVTPPANQTALIGTSKSFSLGSFSQSNATGPFSVSVAWGDGSTATTFSQSSAGVLPSESHTYAAVGTETVTVTVTDANGVTSHSTFTVTVTTGSTPSTTALTISSTSFQSGQSETLTATVTPASATGTVAFEQNGTVLGTVAVGAGGVVTLTTSAFAIGNSVVSATYSGSGTYVSSTSSAIDIDVIPPPAVTTVALQTSTTLITSNQSVTLTANISPATNNGVAATGIVTFYQGSTEIGTAAVGAGGVAVFTTMTGLALGTDSITAHYTGDANFIASTSTAADIQVILTPSHTLITTSTHSKTLAQTETFTAKVGPFTVTPTDLSNPTPTGTVTFEQDGAVLGTVALDSTGTATLKTSTTLPLGIDIITAIYNGDNAFTSSTSLEDDLYVTTNALVPTVTKAVAPASAIGGVAVHGSVTASLTNELTNIETGFEKGTFSVRIFASATTTLDPDSDPIVAQVLRNAKIGEGKTIHVTVPITSMPITLPTGTYHLLVQTTDAAGNTEWTDTGRSVYIIAPVISLSASFVSTPSNPKKGATLQISTSGNVNDFSMFTIVVGFSSDAGGHNIVSSGAGAVQPGKVLVRLGRPSKVHVTGWQSLFDALSAGSYYLTVTVTDVFGNTASAVSSTPVVSTRLT